MMAEEVEKKVEKVEVNENDDKKVDKKGEEDLESKVEEPKKVEKEGKEISTPAVSKKEEPVKSKKDKKEDLIELEREYIVPLKRGSLKVPRYKRAKKAVKVLKEFLAKHMKVENRDLRKVKIDINLNNEIWFRGIKKPTNKIKVKAVKKGGIVYVELAEVPEVIKFKIARLEKRASEVTEAPKKEKEKVEEEKVADKDGDGVEDSTEEEEDKKAGEEKAAKTQKDTAKAQKHTAKAKTGKEEKQTIHRKAMKR